MYDRASDDLKFMSLAIEEARLAYLSDEVPVGACIVCDGKVIARAHNTMEGDRNATMHAEIKAIEQACSVKQDRRLSDCTLYVTLEPCLMCTGALANARIGRVVYAAKDSIAGACGSVINTALYPSGLRCEIVGGVMENEAASLLSDFFAKKRAWKHNCKA